MNAHAAPILGLPDCLAALAGEPRWVGWRWETRRDKAGLEKRTKPPFQASGAYAHNDKPETWDTAAAIMEAVPGQRFEGLGLQLLNLAGFAALDLDKVRNPETGVVLPWAEEAVRWGSYAEVTPSGTGFRVLGRVAPDATPLHRKFRHPDGGEVEFYVNIPTGRYITVTGQRVDGAPDALNPIDSLVATLWDRVKPPEAGPGFTFDTGPGASAGQRTADFADLPEWVRTYIAHGGTGDRSGDFQAAVNHLYRRVDFDTALAFFEAHPAGPASKFHGRLDRELRRSWDKAAASDHGPHNPHPRGYTGRPEGTATEPERASRFYSAADLDGRPVPEREWLVPDLIPGRNVTLFGGDGGTGKSLLALQLAVAVAGGKGGWIGLPATPGRAIYLSAEDDDDELHRRVDGIRRTAGLGWPNLAGLTMRSLAGEDALLAVETATKLMTTALMEELDGRVAEEAPALVILDTLADLYPANENDRAKVRQFVTILRHLAIKRRCAVVLLAHPSLTGMASGSGLSGSTAWSNSVRSRLYLERIKDGLHEPDPDRRVLKTMKLNQGPTGGQLGLTWRAGVFVPDAAPAGLDKMAAGAKAERVFLACLDEFTGQGRHVSPSPSTTYAPTVFAKSPSAEGMTKVALARAMEALFSRGAIVVAQHGRGASKRDHVARAGGAAHAE